MNKRKAIGIFDSGVGGLTVLKQALKKMSNEYYIYIGDTARMPYGEKTKDEVKNFTRDAFKIFEEKGVKAGIIACNTATCYGLNACNENFSFPILGVVRPACEETVRLSKNKKVLLLATQGTVNSNVYKNILKNLDEHLEIFSIGCPELVIAVEDGHYDDEYVKNIFLKYIQKAKFFDFDTIILGCTHFPHARGALEKLLKEEKIDVEIVDPAIASLEKLQEILISKELLSDSTNGNIDFYVSKDIEKFKNNCINILGKEVSSKKFEKIDF